MIGNYCGVRFDYDEVGPLASIGGARAPDGLVIAAVEEHFPSRFHPRWRALRKSTWSWAGAVGILPPGLTRQRFDSLCTTDVVAEYALCAPTPVLQDIADFTVWFFAWDDRQEDDCLNGRDSAWAETSSAVHAALDDPKQAATHHDPLVRGIGDVVDRLSTSLSPAWRARFVHHLHHMVTGYQREYRHRRMGNPPPGVADYLADKGAVFAVEAWVDLIEQAAQYEVTPASPLAALYRKAAATALDFAVLYNDLAGLDRDLTTGEHYNIVVSIAHHTPCSVDEARLRALDTASRKVRQFLRLESRIAGLLPGLTEPERSGTARCLLNARGWISAVYWLQTVSPRYRVPNSAGS